MTLEIFKVTLYYTETYHPSVEFDLEQWDGKEHCENLLCVTLRIWSWLIHLTEQVHL